MAFEVKRAFRVCGRRYEPGEILSASAERSMDELGWLVRRGLVVKQGSAAPAGPPAPRPSIRPRARRARAARNQKAAAPAV